MLELPGLGEALVDELHQLVMAELDAGVPPRPGALELVAAVRAAGIPVGLASNSAREFVERALAVSALANGHFDVVVSADDVAAAKPAPDIYLAACAALGAAPERSAALEDSPPGVAAARAAGMYVIAVPYFPDAVIEGASLLARSLAEPEVAAALALG
jgi:HAD superfamily hydrolase (TIGR01509 family)